MNLDDLQWQISNYGGVPPRVARLLVERAHLDAAVRAAVERGEWWCAREAVRVLRARGHYARARSVVEPFAAVGSAWARDLVAEILIEEGQVDEGLELAYPGDPGRVSDHACRDYAELLVKAGRVDEAISVLAPRLREGWIAGELVKMTKGQGRDEQILALLEPLAAEARYNAIHRTGDFSLCFVQELLATVLERTGRADEAIRTLGADITTDHFKSQSTLTYYARLLARHDRLDELRTLATGDDANTLLDIYADALRDRGRPREAEELVRKFIATTDYIGHRAYLSMVLLKDGRLDDAIDIAAPAFGDYDCSNLLAPLIQVLEGRPEDLLHLLDHPAARAQENHPEFRSWWRPTALARLGRYEEAIDLLNQAPPVWWTDPDTMPAHLLNLAGHTDRAIDHLRTLTSIEAREDLGELLIEQGRPDEGLAVYPTAAEQRAAREARETTPLGDNGYSLEPPF
ncbi:tetratricopeptide repeat protein [Streptomyces tsukubensis]|uniref:tetratricopeptide repeat protein n=1 Tax=Streptomyces tsukubensis TaxID=83656 RepID=UPI00344E69E7